MKSKIFSLFLLCITVLFSRNLNAQNDITAIEMTAPVSLKSGDELPIVVRAKNSSGDISISASETYYLQSDSTAPLNHPVNLKKGVGCLLVTVESDSLFTLFIDGIPGERSVEIIDSPEINPHTTETDSTLEIWDSAFEHRIESDFTIPENSELVIKEGTRVVVSDTCNILVYGTIRVEGTRGKPVIFTSVTPAKPWGGIEIIYGYAEFSYCFFNHGGANESRVFGHSNSQPVIKADHADISLENCFLLYNEGKGLGGRSSRITVNSCIFTHCDTGGEFSYSLVNMTDTYILDIPNDDGIFVDDDNDGFYFLEAYSGSDEPSTLKNCYFFNGKDDGIDHNGAKLEIINCWIEDFMHEGVAASNANYVKVKNTVVKNCEQGIEAGYGSPDVYVDHCVLIENDVGLRFGDSYDWGCSGHLTATNTILYNNQNNIRNYDLKTKAPVENGIEISYSMTNDSDYDNYPHCIIGIPQFNSEYYLAAGSVGTGAGVDASNMGRLHESIKVINEFLALNNLLYCDEYGDFDDWIELYNPTDTPINVGGMYLTDDLSNPTQWQIPTTNPSATTINPGDFLIMWFDGDIDQGELHVNLKLSGTGEQIGLFASDGFTPVDTLSFQAQTENISYGRFTDGSGEWKYFSNPTPGMSNNPENQQSIKEYFITCDPDSLAYIYQNYSEDIYIPITFSHGARTWSDVRMRVRGETSRRSPKKSLRIVFDSQLFSNGRDVLIFNAEYSDKSYIKQYISSKLFRDSGHPCFDAEYAHLYINGDFIGIYLRIEAFDEDFLAARNLDPSGNLYKAAERGACLSIYDDIDYHWQKMTNEMSGNEDLKELIYRINTVSDEDYIDFTREYFDYDKMVNIIALNILIANASTYYHNYHMYHDINNTGKWIMFPWDLDKTLSAYGLNWSYQISGWHGHRTPDNPFLERALLCEPIFNDIKIRIDELSETLFNPQYLSPVIDSLKTLLESSVEQDDTDNVSDLLEWETFIGYDEVYIEARYSNLQNQFNNWPRSFRIERKPDIFTGDVTLKWRPSFDPNGDTVTYSLSYSPTVNLIDSLTTTYTDLSDTLFVLPDIPKPGIYYWTVYASDGTTTIEGFDTRNTFELRTGTELPEEITGDVVFEKARSPYFAYTDIVIAAGASLSAEPGVIIWMPDSASIYVYGEITLEGTSDDPIILSSSGENRWGALCIDNATGQAALSNVVIENASVSSDFEIYDAAVSDNASDITLDNVIFRNVLKGVSVVQGNLIMTDCTFPEGNYGEQVHVKDASAVIENCSFYDVIDGDAIDFENVDSGTISNCRIFTAEDDGVDIGNNSTNISITATHIYNCGDKGISIGQNSSVTIERNVIAGSLTGVAVFDSSSCSIDHTTFFNNDTVISCYEGSHGSGGGTVEITNTIFAQSHTAAIYKDDNSVVTLSYNLFETELLPGEGNIMDDPQFVGAAEMNFNLKPESPCINAGDPDSAFDPDSTRTDIGAFYYYTAFIVINEINYNSSDTFNPDDWIELYNPTRLSVNMSGWIFKDAEDSHSFILPENSILEPDNYLVLCRDTAAFSTFFPEVTNYMGSIGFGLGGNGELIRLYNQHGIIVDSLTFDDRSPWPEEPDGNGPTLSLINPGLDNTLPGSWAASLSHGTPGAINDVYKYINFEVPDGFSLGQNYPNPFNQFTTIPFSLDFECTVTIDVYNAVGQHVSRLVNEKRPSGYYNVIFKTEHFSSGLYFYRIKAASFEKYLKMLLIK